MAGHVTLFVFFTPTLALALNMVGAGMRASSSFIVNIVFGLIGVGLGPPTPDRELPCAPRAAFWHRIAPSGGWRHFLLAAPSLERDLDYHYDNLTR